MASPKFRQLVREEFKLMVEEVKAKAPAIEKKLEELRKKLVPEMVTQESLGEIHNSLPEKRVEVHTVSKIIDIPVNELMLFFLNVTKNGLSENKLIEYHLGQVYFRDTPTK